jgi:hypothetical protein
MANKKMFAIVIAVIIVAGGGGFYGGMKYEQGLAVAQRSQMARQFGANGNISSVPGGRVGGGQGFTNGQIIAKDDKSITVKLRDGGSKIIFFSDTTKIAKTADGSSADLQIGENATVAGNSNSDGSITASSIQLQPAIPVRQ